MRSAVSVALVTSLIGSTPIGGTTKDANGWRFETIQQSTAADHAWSRVRKLKPGTAVIVTVRASAPASRYFVAGDASNLTVLNVGAPTLPIVARNVLRDLASTHPEYFLSALKGGALALDKNVRVSPDGVFVADRKVADLAQVIEEFGRGEITEIATTALESNAVGCAFVGYYGGGIVGGIPGVLIGAAVGGVTGPALVGMMIGWSVGAVEVYRKCKHKPEKLIYSAH
jgi:hypothetical protein